MTAPRFRRHRSPGGRTPGFTGDFPGDDRDITEIFPRADWDGPANAWGGASDIGLPDGGIYPRPPYPPYPDPPPATAPLARLRAQPPAPDMFPALQAGPPPAPPPAPPQPAPARQHDTGPQQRLPRYARTAARPRPSRAPDCAIFVWSSLLSQHIMLCGVCLRSRYADPIAGSMPFTFEALRVSAHVSGWRLDTFGRWACPACQLTPAWWSPAPVVHSHPEIRRRKQAGEDISPFAEATAIAIREHDLICDAAAAAASHGRHRAVTPLRRHGHGGGHREAAEVIR